MLLFSLANYPVVYVVGSYGSSIFKFLGSSILFFIVGGAQIHMPSNSAWGSLLYFFPASRASPSFFDDGHSNRWGWRSFCCDLHFAYDRGKCFRHHLVSWISSLERHQFRFFLRFKLDCFIALLSHEFLKYLGCQILSRYVICKWSFLSHRLSFHFMDGFLYYVEAFHCMIF